MLWTDYESTKYHPHIIFLQNMGGLIILPLKYDIFVENINEMNGSNGDLAEQCGGGSSKQRG